MCMNANGVDRLQVRYYKRVLVAGSSSFKNIPGKNRNRGLDLNLHLSLKKQMCLPHLKRNIGFDCFVRNRNVGEKRGN